MDVSNRGSNNALAIHYALNHAYLTVADYLQLRYTTSLFRRIDSTVLNLRAKPKDV
jgi:hypothetical protein